VFNVCQVDRPRKSGFQGDQIPHAGQTADQRVFNAVMVQGTEKISIEHAGILPRPHSVTKGLEFPVVALVGAGHMPASGEDEREEAKLFYVGATLAGASASATR